MLSLSENEKQMLVHALPSGQIYLMRAGQVGNFVQAGEFAYLDDAEPSLQAIGIDTLEALQSFDLVRFEGGQLYKLTGSGFQLARKYQTELQPA